MKHLFNIRSIGQFRRFLAYRIGAKRASRKTQSWISRVVRKCQIAIVQMQSDCFLVYIIAELAENPEIGGSSSYL